jgi:hypothetical protein
LIGDNPLSCKGLDARRRREERKEDDDDEKAVQAIITVNCDKFVWWL